MRTGITRGIEEAGPTPRLRFEGSIEPPKRVGIVPDRRKSARQWEIVSARDHVRFCLRHSHILSARETLDMRSARCYVGMASEVMEWLAGKVLFRVGVGRWLRADGRTITGRTGLADRLQPKYVSICPRPSLVTSSPLLSRTTRHGMPLTPYLSPRFSLTSRALNGTASHGISP
jgi:hypothetical protein